MRFLIPIPACLSTTSLRRFKSTVLASYDAKKPEEDLFQDFLDIPYQCEVKDQGATLDNFAAMRYNHVPVGDLTSFASAPTSSDAPASVRYVTIEMPHGSTDLLLVRDGDTSWCLVIPKSPLASSESKPW